MSWFSEHLFLYHWYNGISVPFWCADLKHRGERNQLLAGDPLPSGISFRCHHKKVRAGLESFNLKEPIPVPGFRQTLLLSYMDSLFLSANAGVVITQFDSTPGHGLYAMCP